MSPNYELKLECILVHNFLFSSDFDVLFSLNVLRQLLQQILCIFYDFEVSLIAVKLENEEAFVDLLLTYHAFI